VRQRAFEHVGQDLHIAVAVCAEASARRDEVFVDDAQVAHAHVCRVMVVGERKTVMALEPAMVGMAPVSGLAQRDHPTPPVCEAP
jgi:hypothetical protein